MINYLKKNKDTYIYILLITTILGCSKNSKVELTSRIENDIETIESIIENSSIKFEVYPVTDNNFDETYGNHFINYLTTKTSINEETIKNHFDSINVYLKTSYPYNFITEPSHFWGTHHKKSFNIRNDNQFPTVVPISITFINGSSKKINDNYLSSQKIIEKYQSKEYENKNLNLAEEKVYRGRPNFAIKNSKPIKDITFDVFFPNIKSAILSKPDDSIDTPFGKVYLYGISGRKVTIEYPTKLGEDNIEVRGIYKDGRILYEKGGSYAIPVISKNDFKTYNNYLNLLKKTKEKLENEDIQTEEQVNNFIKKHSQKINKSERYTRKSIYFSGPVDRTNIRVLNENQKKEKYTFTSKAYYYFTNYKIAEDLVTKKEVL